MENDKEPTEAPRRVLLVLIYTNERTTRTGRRHPVGGHIRGELRDLKTGEVLNSRKASPFTVEALRALALRRGWKITGRRFDIDGRPVAPSVVR